MEQALLCRRDIFGHMVYVLYFWGNILPTSASLAPWLIIMTRDSSYQVEVCTTVPVIILHGGPVAFLLWSAVRYAIIAPDSLRNWSVYQMPSNLSLSGSRRHCQLGIFGRTLETSPALWPFLSAQRPKIGLTRISDAFLYPSFSALYDHKGRSLLRSLLLSRYAWITFRSLRLEYVHNPRLEPWSGKLFPLCRIPKLPGKVMAIFRLGVTVAGSLQEKLQHLLSSEWHIFRSYCKDCKVLNLLIQRLCMDLTVYHRSSFVDSFTRCLYGRAFSTESDTRNDLGWTCLSWVFGNFSEYHNTNSISLPHGVKFCSSCPIRVYLNLSSDHLLQ